jgi:hypothetical protein
MEKVCFSEMPIPTYKSTWQYNSEQHRHVLINIIHATSQPFQVNVCFQTPAWSSLMINIQYCTWNSNLSWNFHCNLYMTWIGAILSTLLCTYTLCVYVKKAVSYKRRRPSSSADHLATMSGGFQSWEHYHHLTFHNRHNISWTAKHLSASQDLLCSMELVNSYGKSS